MGQGLRLHGAVARQARQAPMDYDKSSIASVYDAGRCYLSKCCGNGWT